MSGLAVVSLDSTCSNLFKPVVCVSSWWRLSLQLLLTLLSTDDYEILHQVLKLLATLGRYFP